VIIEGELAVQRNGVRADRHRARRQRQTPG
jgi:hypothetical protein